MKGKQKILLLVCSVIAVVSVSCMAAYALLKTVTETKTNVFASDKSISIDLTEPQWERYGKEAAKVYVPGQTIDKDPTVSLNDESISAYVALKGSLMRRITNSHSGNLLTDIFMEVQSLLMQELTGLKIGNLLEMPIQI